MISAAEYKNNLVTEIGSLFYKANSLDESLGSKPCFNFHGKMRVIKSLNSKSELKEFLIVSIIRNDTPYDSDILEQLSYMTIDGVYEPIINLCIESLYEIYHILTNICANKDKLLAQINEVFDINVKTNDNGIKYLPLNFDEFKIFVNEEHRNIYEMVRYDGDVIKLMLKIEGLNGRVPWYVSTESMSLVQLENLYFFLQGKF